MIGPATLVFSSWYNALKFSGPFRISSEAYLVRYIMIMPPTMKLIAMNRNSSVDPLVCSSKRKFEKRLIMAAKKNTNSGRLLYIADTKDTEPLCTDQ